jgi:hypothetical protein
MNEAEGPHGPLNPAPPHVALREQEEEMRETGKRMGFGRLLGAHVIGDTLVWRFEKTSVTTTLPPGSRTT